MFAVIYQSYIKSGRESDYQSAWRKIATYFVEERGALGSCLHRGESGLWVAYSRWPNRETRDASWPKDAEICLDLPEDIQRAAVVLKDCLESQLPEIAMEVVDDLLAQSVQIKELES